MRNTQESASLFDQWNKVLAEHFFNAERAGQRVWLSVTRDLLDELGQRLDQPAAPGDGAADLLEAVVHRQKRAEDGICTLVCRDFDWTTPNATPSYLAYLAVFVLAVGEGDVFGHERGYFGALNKLVPWADADTHNFDVTDWLWSDLERWSRDLHHGERGWWSRDGLPHKNAWFRVQRVRLQALLTHDEERVAAYILAAKSAGRHEPAGGGDLAGWLLRHGRPCLRPITHSTLKQEHGSRYESLVLRLAQLLIDWDGEPPANAEGIRQRLERERAELIPKRGQLWLTCGLNPTGPGQQRAVWGLRAEVTDGFPEDHLRLTGQDRRCYTATESWTVPGLSERLRLAGSGQDLELRSADVLNAMTLTDAQRRTYTLGPRSVRILVADPRLGRGLTERWPPPAEGQLYVLYSKDNHARLKDLISQGQGKWLGPEQMPPNSLLAAVSYETCLSVLRAGGLKLPPGRIIFEGVRLERRQHWWADLPPRVRLVGSSAQETLVKPSDQSLVAIGQGWHELPEAARQPGCCRVIVKWPEHTVQRFITLEQLATKAPPEVRLDSLGRPTSQEESISGAWVSGASTEQSPVAAVSEPAVEPPLAAWLARVMPPETATAPICYLPASARPTLGGRRGVPAHMLGVALAAARRTQGGEHE